MTGVEKVFIFIANLIKRKFFSRIFLLLLLLGKEG